MVSFVALYRGPNLPSARLIAVSTNRELVGLVAEALLAEQAQEIARVEDPAAAAVADGMQRALELVRDESAVADPAARRDTTTPGRAIRAPGRGKPGDNR